ncbi:CsbD family protein [Nevskia sp.]|uniref:CsbD family protein n=1 Tax=Nevskia sp. TaxID=1929292 RepID=UPI002601430C|nr:CsbD family protein [Nevskia sp.]
MNEDTIEGQWKQLKGKAKTLWGKLTDDELTQAEGNVDRLAGLVQERYGISHDQARKQVNDFMNNKR